MSTQNVAEILLGIRYKQFNGAEIECGDSCGSLVINGKILTSPKSFPAKNPQFKEQERNYRSFCSRFGINTAMIMKKNGVSEYTITQGFRLRHTTKERIKCEEEMPQDGTQLFIEELERHLHHKLLPLELVQGNFLIRFRKSKTPNMEYQPPDASLIGNALTLPDINLWHDESCLKAGKTPHCGRCYSYSYDAVTSITNIDTNKQIWSSEGLYPAYLW